MTLAHLARVYTAGAATATPGSDLARVLSVMAAEAGAVAEETEVGTRDTVPLDFTSLVPERLPEDSALRDEYLREGTAEPWAAWLTRRRTRARFGSPKPAEVTVTLRLLLAAPDEVLAEGLAHLNDAERDVIARALRT